ncbi:MAG: HAD-IC family P-type ATPase, partial [Gammaproteobacteria bacterium]|nr:HAD-IC family P-type ATPase [Gammaproteobacteria bacterium]
MSVPTSSGQSTPWTEKPSDLAKQLETDLQLGLSQQLAEQRLLRLGPNHLTEQGQRSARSLFLSQFTDFMIIVLIIAAIVSGVVGDAVDALVIVVIILINAIIGFSQEYRAERALAALRALSTPDCKVRRDGHVHTIATEQLVTGDLVLLEAGDYVPADCRLVDVADVHVDESALTGESTTVSKVNNALENENLVVADRKNMVFRGTLITHGRAVGLVTATGMSTEMGKVAELLNSGEKEKTPLQVRIKDFGRRLAIAVLLICGVLMAMGILRGEPVMLMFLTAISLAVAAIPEALPAVITVVLGLGAKKMVQQNALVRKLPAVETLGSTTVICSDKTGTLTQNKMHVEECVCVSGARNVLVPADAARGAWALMGQALALSNDVEKGKDGSPNGDPTEVAAYQFAANAGYKKEILSQLFPRVLEIPFESNRKRMTTFHVQEGGLIAFTKGAPEKVLAVCRYQLGPEGVESLDNDYFLQEAEGLAENGYRVLGYAYRNWNTLPDTKEEEEVENDLVFLGLVAMMDPPRPEAAEAVKLCKEAGIRPIMITGD